MPKFAANLSMLFTEFAFLDRFGAAAEAGFRAVECQFPYDHPAETVAAALHQAGLEQVLINLPAGDWARGERGIAIDPDRVEEFRAGVETGIRYAQALGCTQVNCLAGLVPEGTDRAVLEATFIANLRHAATRLESTGIRLVIEALNDRDVPGFYLTGTAQGLALIEAVGSENLKLQYDIYHMQVMEGDIAGTLRRHLDRIGHIQFADTPGRHEPGTGELDFGLLFRHLDAIGYDGWVAAEYRPLTTTREGLAWLRDSAAG